MAQSSSRRVLLPPYASHTNTSFPGLLKTIFRLLGIPPLNLFDASASDLADVFHSRTGFCRLRRV
jgi:hypothetical protein